MLTLPDAFQPAILPPSTEIEQPALWFVFAGSQLLVRSTDQRSELPLASVWPFAKWPPKRRLYLGTLGGQPCHTAEVVNAKPPPGWTFENLRGLWMRLDDTLLGVAGHALQLIEWDRSHQFCGQCGTPTEHRTEERARYCPACQLAAYPRLSPVIMVRVIRDQRILLARAPRFAPGVYSVLAGFVEAGETLEQTIHREVAEETGIQVHNLCYFASQSWPFPHSLMIAFTADYAGGELQADGREILDARWFAPNEMPDLPSPMSMAWRLIQDYLAHHR
ncbi:MAG TPA: NAD(+) diphosphatase [Candidatus Competibacteraceae bacterium]|nr:NAD(+) diphosphatase [Candidatus Competibacteraceae bacterium]